MPTRYYVGTKKDLNDTMERIKRLGFSRSKFVAHYTETKRQIISEYGSMEEFYRVHGKKYVHRIRV